ncbi:MAG: formylmethanofuran dehydrogenase subunit C [Pirellulaceae bacterium]|jgi:formylmethanofuran dehydrogenase subunit C
MALTLQLTAEPTVPLEIEGFIPEVVRECTLDEIRKKSVFHGNRTVELGEFFDVAGDPSDCELHLQGDMSRVHWIGAQMTTGKIRIEGDGGRHIGSEMRGGEIHVSGDASDWVGAEMKGGLIDIKGSAGHLVGAAYRGSARGMTGGTILVHGKVGNELGHTMRRGLIAAQSCGDLAGFNMLAGSILVFGESGIRHGAGMRRGTIGFLGQEHPPLLPTFKYACRFRPDICQLVFRELIGLGYPVPKDLLSADLDLYNGDLIEGGRGEILLRAV